MSRILKIKANFHQVGSVYDKAGAGDDYDIYVVGDRDVVSIVNIYQGLLTHRVIKSDGTKLDIGNVFHVEYARYDECDAPKCPLQPITHEVLIYSCYKFEEDIAIYSQIGEGRENDLVRKARKAVKNLRETIEIKVKNSNNEIEGKK